MAYNPLRPSDTDLVKKSAELIRENFEGLRTDGIVFAKPPLYGAGEPKASAGENGDRYIDTVNGNHYYKNSTGQWELNLSLDDKYKTIKDVKTIVEELQAMIAVAEHNIKQTDMRLENFKDDLKDSGTVYNSERLENKAPDYYRCANGCSWTCSSECSGGCGNGCTGSCMAGCTGGCSSCSGTCSGGCSNNCTGSCMGSCKSCSGCSGCSGPN